MTHPTKGAATMVSDEARQRACDLANAFNRDCWKFDAADVEQQPALLDLAQLCQDISDAVAADIAKSGWAAALYHGNSAKFILSKPAPDPLAEAINAETEGGGGHIVDAGLFAAALTRRLAKSGYAVLPVKDQP